MGAFLSLTLLNNKKRYTACSITTLISNHFTAYRTVMYTKLNTARISTMSQEKKETFFFYLDQYFIVSDRGYVAEQLQLIKATETVKKEDHSPPDLWFKTSGDHCDPSILTHTLIYTHCNVDILNTPRLLGREMESPQKDTKWRQSS